MLSLLARWCLFAVKHLQLGWHESNPRDIVKKVNKWNASAAATAVPARGGAATTQEGDEETLAYYLDDISDFFTNVGKERFREVVQDVLRRLERLQPGLHWF